MRLLIADDDRDLARLIGYTARMLWPDCESHIAADGPEALHLFTLHRPNFVVLDVTTPGQDGFEVCRRIRQAAPDTTILMLSERDVVSDEIRGFDMGTDDYLTKPLDPLRLFARLRALRRRAAVPPTLAEASRAADVVIGDLTIAFSSQEVRLRGEQIPLTPTEYVLLEYLARNAGQIVSHRALLEHVWGAEFADETNYLKVFINRLRQKLGESANSQHYIRTLRGIGYRLAVS